MNKLIEELEALVAQWLKEGTREEINTCEEFAHCNTYQKRMFMLCCEEFSKELQAIIDRHKENIAEIMRCKRYNGIWLGDCPNCVDEVGE